MKSYTYTCDRCGRFDHFTKDQGTTPEKWTWLIDGKGILCEKCAKALTEWVESGKARNL